jgi:hypothetical protein
MEGLHNLVVELHTLEEGLHSLEEAFLVLDMELGHLLGHLYNLEVENKVNLQMVVVVVNQHKVVELDP